MRLAAEHSRQLGGRNRFNIATHSAPRWPRERRRGFLRCRHAAQFDAIVLGFAIESLRADVDAKLL